MLAMCKKRVTFCDKVTERYPNEWTLKLTVPNISSMKDPVISVPCIIGNLPWRIKIMKKEKVVKDNTSPYLGFFLQCDVCVDDNDWSCYAVADLRLINQEGGKTISKPLYHMFCSKVRALGYPEYLNWSDMEDPSKGFVKDESVIFEVKVTANAEFVESKHSYEKEDYVKIDFELNNLITKKGVVLSPSIKFGELWWRFRLESSKEKWEESVKVEVCLVCEGLNSQGGGAKWSCDITGNVEFVNQLDSNKNKVEHFANRKLNYNSGSSSFFDKIPFDQISTPSCDGSIMLKARVVVGNSKIIQSDRYAKILERRKDKETQHEGDKGPVVKQPEPKKSKQPSRLRKQLKMISSSCSNTVPAISPVENPKTYTLPTTWTKIVSNVSAISSDIFQVKIDGVDQVILIRWASLRLVEPWSMKVKEVMGRLLGADTDGNVVLWVRNVGWEDDVQLVDIKDQKLKDIAELLSKIGFMEETAEVAANDESDQFKQDLCQSLNSIPDVGSEMVIHKEEEDNPIPGSVKKRRRKRTVYICCRPSCTEKAIHRCSRCLSVRFCSQECNEQHWAVHREQCKDAVEREREAEVD